MTNVPEGQEAVNPASPEFFFGAATIYAEATENLGCLIENRWERQRRQNAIRDALKDIEARLIINGQVEGKNEAERKARLQVLLADDPEAEGQRKKLADVEDDLNAIEVEAETQRGRQLLARYKMRYADATLRYLANLAPESPHESEA